MIVLDTNVLSELTRHNADQRVIAWLDSVDASQLATTAICAGELLYGVARLPDGRRKARLAEAVRSMLRDDFAGRIEPFDAIAAGHYADIVVAREKIGRPISAADAQIAAICRKHKAALATRNTKDFDGVGIESVNPWRAAGTQQRRQLGIDHGAFTVPDDIDAPLPDDVRKHFDE